MTSEAVSPGARHLVPLVLRANPDFRKAFSGDLLSSLGTAMSTIAFPLLVLAIGGGPIRAGSIATVSLVTRLALRLPAGHLVDGWNRRYVMLTSDLVRFVVLASVPIIGIIGHPTYLQLLLVALVEGTASSLFGPSIYVMTRDILPSDQLADGLGLSQAVQAATALIGPGIGGALYGLHRLLPFAVDSLSYLASAILIWRIASRPAAQVPKKEGRGRISDGIRWILGQRALFMIMVFATVINFVSAAIDVLVVLVLRSHGVSSGFIGLVLSCSGVGAIVGSLLSTVLVKRMSVPMLLLGIGVGWSIALGLFAAFYSPWLIAVLLVLLMTLSPAAGVIVGQALISRAPRDLLGRVGAATSVLLSGLASIGPVLAGVIFVGLGRSGSWLTLAVLTAAITAACWVPLQATRSLKADPAGADGEPVESLATEAPPSST